MLYALYSHFGRRCRYLYRITRIFFLKSVNNFNIKGCDSECLRCQKFILKRVEKNIQFRTILKLNL